MPLWGDTSVMLSTKWLPSSSNMCLFGATRHRYIHHRPADKTTQANRFLGFSCMHVRNNDDDGRKTYRMKRTSTTEETNVAPRITAESAAHGITTCHFLRRLVERRCCLLDPQEIIFVATFKCGVHPVQKVRIMQSGHNKKSQGRTTANREREVRTLHRFSLIVIGGNTDG